jgi:hypothetical protein
LLDNVEKVLSASRRTSVGTTAVHWCRLLISENDKTKPLLDNVEQCPERFAKDLGWRYGDALAPPPQSRENDKTKPNILDISSSFSNTSA